MENSTNIDNPPSQVSSNLTDSKKRSNVWLILIIGLAFTIGIISAFYFGLNFGKSQNSSVDDQQTIPQPTSPPTPTASQIPEPTNTPVNPLVSPTAAVVTQPPATSVVRITPLSTQGWQNVKNGQISFKIPPDATCNDNVNCSKISVPFEYEGKTMPPSVISVNVSEYQGGSRREQYLSKYPDIKECRPIFINTLFGSVEALQIAIDGGWCQGGYAGAVVVVLGDAFITVGPSLSYVTDQEISRWDVRDTVISTLSTK